MIHGFNYSNWELYTADGLRIPTFAPVAVVMPEYIEPYVYLGEIHAFSMEDFTLSMTAKVRKMSRKRFARNSERWRVLKRVLGEDYRAIRKQIRRQERWRRETLKRW